MTPAQPELVFPSEPLSGDVLATVELVGHDWRSDEDWRRFRDACLAAGESYGGEVNPNVVRRYCDGRIEPRRYSAFWSRASRGKDAFLVADGWVVNTDTAGRNQGKPLRRYRLREAS